MKIQVDPEDQCLLDSYAWSINGHGYASTKIDGRSTSLHTCIAQAMGILSPDPNMVIDHINRDRLDNRRGNLRVVTYSQNNYNSKVRKDNTTGFKGVTYRAKQGKFIAQISLNGKTEHLGFFDTAEEASEVYEIAVKKAFNGETADRDVRVNTTGFKGVTKPGNRYQARIVLNGKRKSLGYFKTPEKAALAYLMAGGI